MYNALSIQSEQDFLSACARARNDPPLPLTRRGRRARRQIHPPQCIAVMPLLEILGLRKVYRAPDGSSQTILSIDHFELEAGSQCALSGASGSGKTTLLHLIAGIATPDAGRIRLDGTETSSLPEPHRDRLRARTIGYIFQTFNLLPAYTCLENVLVAMSFAGAVDHDRAEALLKRVGLSDRLKYRPHQLSTGQQQRVAVARALANCPRLDRKSIRLNSSHEWISRMPSS